jgi:cytidylate kinase
MKRSLVLAIDGYSSCGKSTVAREIAQKLGIRYIDSGAMYRAVTLYFLRNDIPFHENGKTDPSVDLSEVLSNINIEFRLNSSSGLSEIYLNGENIEKEIRGMEVSSSVSDVSMIPQVREKLVWLQQHLDRSGGIVMDGRDIGTNVFPDADLKIFMTADTQVRAKRRYDEMVLKNIPVSFDEVLDNLRKRDHDDTHREISPLEQAPDAVVLDNTGLNREEQLDFILNILKERGLITNDADGS